ncbi:MAG: hypothetical protein Q9N62_13425 [Ghiorsea sp.]|nr:hypothetical protein [Ghiorsea sp.]
MDDKTDYSCDLFKPLELLGNPDPRSILTKRTKEIEKMHEHISQFSLSDEVPIDVRIKFDTARNLYIYSWYVYRFTNIAEHQLFICLEFGLRELLLEELPMEYKNRHGDTSIEKLLRYIVDSRYLKSEDFKRYQHRVRKNAESRYKQTKYEEMDEKGLNEITYNLKGAMISEEDHFDFFEPLIKYIRYFRNEYAHGSTMLFGNITSTFEDVSEILNSVYSRKKG